MVQAYPELPAPKWVDTLATPEQGSCFKSSTRHLSTLKGFCGLPISTHGQFLRSDAKSCSDIESHFVSAAKHASYCGAQIMLPTFASPSEPSKISIGGKPVAINASRVQRALTAAHRRDAQLIWEAHPHSGKAAQSLKSAPSTSRWMGGEYVTPSLYSYLLRMRTTTLPTPTNARRWQQKERVLCIYGCEMPATQAHILTGCQKFRSLYVERHDRVLGRLARDIRSSAKYNDWTVRVNPQLDSDMRTILPAPVQYQRPDLILRSGDKTRGILVELTLSHIDGQNATLYRRTEAKRERYHTMVSSLQSSKLLTSVELVCLTLGAGGVVNPKP
jgi:hypothetical protein